MKKQKWGMIFISPHPYILGGSSWSARGVEYFLWEINFTEFLEFRGLLFFQVILYYFLPPLPRTTFFPQVFHAFLIRLLVAYSFRNLVDLFAKMDLWGSLLHRERGVV